MKRWMSLLAAAVLCSSFSALAEEDLSADVPAGIAAEEVAALCDFAEAETQAGAAELAGWLEEVRTGYFPGTAGCSLTAAAFAGRLLDWAAETALDSGEMEQVAAAYASRLTEGEITALEEQLEQLYFAAQALCGSGSADLLESAGYEAKYAPWDAGTVEMLFAVLGDGLCSGEETME